MSCLPIRRPLDPEKAKKTFKKSTVLNRLQIIAKFSQMTFRDSKCYRLLWKLIIISWNLYPFSELIKAKRTSENNNPSATIGTIPLEGAFWFSDFTEILKSQFSWIKILSLNNYSVAWNGKKSRHRAVSQGTMYQLYSTGLGILWCIFKVHWVY